MILRQLCRRITLPKFKNLQLKILWFQKVKPKNVHNERVHQERIMYQLFFNSCVFLPFKTLEGVFRDLRSQNDLIGKKLTRISPGSSTENEPKIRRFFRASEDICVRTTSSCYQFRFLLVVHSKKGACLLKGKKRRNYYALKRRRNC